MATTPQPELPPTPEQAPPEVLPPSPDVDIPSPVPAPSDEKGSDIQRMVEARHDAVKRGEEGTNTLRWPAPAYPVAAERVA